MSFHAHVVLALAGSPSPSQSTPTSPMPGESDSTWLGPGFLGFLSLVFLALAVFVIWKSLNKQLTRVTFDEESVNAAEPDEPPTRDAGPAAGGPGPARTPVE